ncbi:MAG: NADH dehydrogenase (quinone) subunit D [Armatimonadota bacterium]|nr:NADH dehydrogenase (quinone) subunit D [Armatimonadota bacterium]MDR7451860.1 NADH dehydrogenase (quinone) subunit D [Armatimonadota bacterium]MDR7467585.1 NADH dehydrogenase (quinone) subunit D [Armatimonadota bacterium]MDR7494454.1 NADH dehydrogenase (quinone) subunit D [Armatimonadota bacterium]MDR7499715.1 NADH dehydrogenase (quinone) subunit D [Armatimonadota bacterium]
MSELAREAIVLNMGPHHPSTHGVLRLMVELEGEVILRAEPVIGYLHTGFEKEMETRTYHQNIVFPPRIEYLATMIEEHAYVLAVEKLLGIRPPRRAEIIRIILAELSRIASHLVWLGTSAIDVNVTSLLMYCFNDRERILDLFEAVSGQRMMHGYMRIGGLQWDIPEEFPARVREVVEEIPRRLEEYERLLSDNLIWRQRTEGVAVLTRQDALRYGCTGPIGRGSGLNYDVRKAFPYGGYEEYDFDVPLGRRGDAYDRYLVRMEEMRQSCRIIRQALDRLEPGPVLIDDRKVALPPRRELVRSMEAVIHQFKLVSEGIHPPPGQVYAAVESPRGEKGYFVVSDGSNRPVRVRVRAPSFHNLQALPVMLFRNYVADVVVAIASIDIVLGDVDR